MKNKVKTKEQLDIELKELHQRIDELAKSETNKKLQKEFEKLKKIEKSLRDSEEKYRILVEMAVDAIFLETTEGRILECNITGAKMYGYTKEEMVGLTIADLVPEEFTKTLPVVISEEDTTNDIFVPCINKKKDGTLFPTEIATKFVNMGGKSRLVVYIRDITERKKNEKLQGVLYNISKAANSDISLNQLYPLIHRELNNIIDATNFFIALIDIEKDEISFPYHKDEKDSDIPNRKFSQINNLTTYVIRSGQSLLVNLEDFKKMVEKGDFELRYTGILTANSHWLGVPLKIENEIIGAMVVQGYIGPHLFSKKDVQLLEFISEQVATAIERKQLEEKLEKLAHFDSLSGAYNRGYGLSLLERELQFARRRKTSFLLAYIDMDNFKYINDTFSHEEGDQVLKKVVLLLKSCLREIDIICRMGGDEFLLIFPESSLNNTTLIRERLDKNLEKLNQTFNKSYNIGFSIGISCYDPDHPQSIDELISIADENMYKEKKKKRK